MDVETALRLAFAGLLGLAFGSFLTVVVHRVPRGESVVSPRSRCPRCGVQVRPRDNVPVLSFLLLGGRCRDCRAPISPRYPLTEAATAGLFVAAAARFEHPYEAMVLALFFAVMLSLALVDAELRIVPNRITYPSLAVFAVLIGVGVAIGEPLNPTRAAVGFAAYGGALLVVALLSGGMGMGDVKLAALIGLVLGSLGLAYVVVAAAAAVLGGGVGAVAALAVARMSRKDAIPFGPYLAAGAVAAAFVAPSVAAWYTSALR